MCDKTTSAVRRNTKPTGTPQPEEEEEEEEEEKIYFGGAPPQLGGVSAGGQTKTRRLGERGCRAQGEITSSQRYEVT